MVKLPLLTAPQALIAAERQPPGAEVPLPAGVGDGTVKRVVRVLVVDDNIDLVAMLCGTLRLKGFVVQSAYTGPEGLRIAQEWRPDIALLDIGLPDMDGYEIARRLRSGGVLAVAGEGAAGTGAAGARMKLIAITGYGREDDVALALEAGFDAHMTKPVDFDELEKQMNVPAAAGT